MKNKIQMINRDYAIQCLFHRTNGRGRVENGLYEPSNAEYRAEILSNLTGRKWTKTEAAWNQFLAVLFAEFKIPINECTAVQLDILAEKIRSEVEASQAQ